MARLTKELRDECRWLLDEYLTVRDEMGYDSPNLRRVIDALVACSVDYPDLANHPTATELADGRVQITLTAEEWRAVREASK